MTNTAALVGLVAALFGAAPAVEVQLAVKKPLHVTKRGELRGALEVQVLNRGTDAVTLQHRDVHGFRFVPSAGDTGPQLVFHSCDCGFEQGLQPPPDSRTFTLQPGEVKVLRFDDFTCGGGPFHPPPPGRYQVSFSLGAPAAAPKKGSALDLKRCEADLKARGPAAFESNPVTVELRKPR